MEVLVDRCAGIDIGKADMKVCVRVPGRRAGTRHGEVRTFSTTTQGVLQARDWLMAERVERVGMESTGVYWKPVFYLLEDVVQTWLLNAHHLKKVPGRKSDVSDAQWIAQLIECGLVRPSFVPPPPIRQLRDLTRYRTTLVRERAREVARLHAVLEDAGIKLDCVATDILGVSGRSMIEALISGVRDPIVLADLARARLRVKSAALAEALSGRFETHHGFLCRQMLDRIDQADASIDQVTVRIEEQMEPFRELREHLRTIPGVQTRLADVIIAETGADMTRFATAQALASWAGMCPGNNESAGKHHSTTTRKGDTWLRGALGQAAASAARTKNTYLAARYRRLVARRGKKRALVAVGHSILEAAWYLMTYHVDYADLGPDHFNRTADTSRRAQYLANQIRDLGYGVHLEPPAA